MPTKPHPSSWFRLAPLFFAAVGLAACNQGDRNGMGVADNGSAASGATATTELNADANGTAVDQAIGQTHERSGIGSESGQAVNSVAKGVH